MLLLSKNESTRVVYSLFKCSLEAQQISTCAEQHQWEMSFATSANDRHAEFRN